MNSNEIIYKLADSAAFHIHELTKRNAKLSDIDKVSIGLINSDYSSERITNDEAKKFANYVGNSGGVEKNFDPTLHDISKTLARLVIELAVLTENQDTQTHQDLIKIADYLYPLLTMDSRTNELGFELQEYADTFVDLDQHDREKSGKKLLESWYLAGYIDKSKQPFMNKTYDDEWHSNKP
jgi:hypothetical protein